MLLSLLQWAQISRLLLTPAIFQISRDSIDDRATGRWGEMRSEKEQMTVGKEKSVVEIQFRDIPGEQENASGNAKQKEEKKEIFTKVGIECWRCRSKKKKQTWTEVGSFSTADSDKHIANDATVSPSRQQLSNVVTLEKHRKLPCC